MQTQTQTQSQHLKLSQPNSKLSTQKLITPGNRTSHGSTSSIKKPKPNTVTNKLPTTSAFFAQINLPQPSEPYKFIGVQSTKSGQSSMRSSGKPSIKIKTKNFQSINKKTRQSEEAMHSAKKLKDLRNNYLENCDLEIANVYVRDHNKALKS